MGKWYVWVLCRRGNKQSLKSQPLGLSEGVELDLRTPAGWVRAGRAMLALRRDLAGNGGVQCPDAPLWVVDAREKKTPGKETAYQAKSYLLPLEIAKTWTEVSCVAGRSRFAMQKTNAENICIADIQTDLKLCFPSSERGRLCGDHRAARGQFWVSPHRQLLTKQLTFGLFPFLVPRPASSLLMLCLRVQPGTY